MNGPFVDPFARQPSGPGQVLPEATMRVILLHSIGMSDDAIDQTCAKLRALVADAAPDQIVGVMSGRDCYRMFLRGQGKNAWSEWATNLPGMFHLLVVPLVDGDSRVGRGAAQAIKNALTDRHPGLRAWNPGTGSIYTVTGLAALSDLDPHDPLQWCVTW